MFQKILILYGIFPIIITITAGAIENEEGYEIGCLKCHPIDENKTNIHLIPHSHDDVGWVKTIDEYYFGDNTGQVSVSIIISSVVESLLRNPDRRYIQVETAFFDKWWNEEGNENIREDFRRLVENGQIEMVNGAWSMNDEACVNYQSTIDQFAWGLRKIEETVGKCGRPRVGWQIDPFGHSREQASILAQMGYDGVFLGRIDYEDKNRRTRHGDMDFLWKGSANLENTYIFGSLFPNNLYNEPDGFCWDILCDDNQIVEDPESTIYNLPEVVESFTKTLERFTSYYPKNVRHILIPMGGDFQFQAASKNFRNMDILIKAFKNNTKYNLIYSTPSCYIKAVNDGKPILTLKTDDFFPYSDASHSFWAGYFSSRPTVKRFERTGHNILQATKQMYALSPGRSHDHKLESLRETMGVLQHHDAITGTEQQHVTHDYVQMLTEAIKKAEEPVGEIISGILRSKADLSLSSCLLSNISICDISQRSEKFIVTVYNPLAWKTTHYVRIPVQDMTYEIHGPDGQEENDVLQTLSPFDHVKIKNETPSSHELVFAARDIPPLGFKIYHIQRVRKEENRVPNNLVFKSSAFEVNETTSLLKSVTLNNIVVNLSQNFHFYQSHDGLANGSYTAAGAYIFRPLSNSAQEFTNATILRQYSGNLVEEIHQKWENIYADIYQSIRWYKNENYVEFDWIVGNIDLNNITTGKEIITRFTIDTFNNNNTFYTDSNGREMLKRVKDHRPDYTYNISNEPVASNYYPVTSRIVLKDEEKNLEVALLTDRAQGGTSLENGQMELLVHRRLIFDDYKGVEESLNEYEFGLGLYARGSHYLVLGTSNGTNRNNLSTAAQARILAQKKLLQPWVGLSATHLTFEQFKEQMNLSFSSLNEELPENINILTLEPWSEDRFLVRFEHIMEKNDDPVLSKPALVPNIQTLFRNINISELTETTLAANLILHERIKYAWTWNDSAISDDADEFSADSQIILKPMEIRTFILRTNSGDIIYNNVYVSLFLLFVYLF